MLIFMSPKVEVYLNANVHIRGAKIPLARMTNDFKVVLKEDDKGFRFCKVDMDRRYLDPDFWKDLNDEYFLVQGTDLPTYVFDYRYGDFHKTVKIYGPPNFPEKISKLFRAISESKCISEVKPKMIVLNWEKVYVKRIATPLGKFEGLLGKDTLKGKDLNLGYEFIKKYGKYLFLDGIFSDSKGRTYRLRVNVKI